MRSKSTNNQIHSMKIDSNLNYSLKGGLYPSGMDSHKKSILIELKEEALLAKYKERIQKQNNSTSSFQKINQPLPITSVATPSSSKNNKTPFGGTHRRFLSQFDKNKFEMDKNIILPMPQISINYLTKTKKPTNIKSEKRGSYDYIEVDKKKYNETVKYLNQQQLQEQRKGSFRLRQRILNQSTPASRRHRSIHNSTDYNSPQKTSYNHTTFEDSYNNMATAHTQTLSNFSLDKNQTEPEQHRNMMNNNSDQQMQQPPSSEFHPHSQQSKDQNLNDFKRSSFYRRDSLNKSFSNLFSNNEAGRSKISSSYYQQNQHIRKPSNFLSAFSVANNNKEQAKANEYEEQQTLKDEQETCTTVKNHTNDLTALIRQRLGSTRRSSNMSMLSDNDKNKERTNSFLFRGSDLSKQRQSFYASLPYNKHIFDQIQKNSQEFKQDVLNNMTNNKFLQDLTKYKEKRANKDNKDVIKNEAVGFKQFAIHHFAPNSLERLKTFFQFAFTSVDKGEDKQITSALNEILDNLNAKGTMQIIDLWSAKSLKNCIERTNMTNERSVIQQFLYYKAKYDTVKKEEKKQQAEVLSRQKELNLKSQLLRQEQARKQLNADIQKRDSTFLLEDDDTQYIHNQQMLMNSSQFNLRYKNALNTIIEEIKDMRQENIEDIKNTKLLDKIQKKVSEDLEKKHKISKILKQ